MKILVLPTIDLHPDAKPAAMLKVLGHQQGVQLPSPGAFSFIG
ncbi:hypothetical protein ACFLSW_01420 [Candidatus Bipolaricaulota bacterium]